MRCRRPGATEGRVAPVLPRAALAASPAVPQGRAGASPAGVPPQPVPVVRGTAATSTPDAAAAFTPLPQRKGKRRLPAESAAVSNPNNPVGCGGSLPPLPKGHVQAVHYGQPQGRATLIAERPVNSPATASGSALLLATAVQQTLWHVGHQRQGDRCPGRPDNSKARLRSECTLIGIYVIMQLEWLFLPPRSACCQPGGTFGGTP